MNFCMWWCVYFDCSVWCSVWCSDIYRISTQQYVEYSVLVIYVNGVNIGSCWKDILIVLCVFPNRKRTNPITYAVQQNITIHLNVYSWDQRLVEGGKGLSILLAIWISFSYVTYLSSYPPINLPVRNTHTMHIIRTIPLTKLNHFDNCYITKKYRLLNNQICIVLWVR